MARANLCRLCVNVCNDFKSLYDHNSHRNEIYDVTVKYFHPMFLNVEQGSHLTVICLECWRHISDFYSFQQSVFLAQTQLLEDEKQVLSNANLETVCRLPQEPRACSNNETVRSPETEIDQVTADIANDTVVNGSNAISPFCNATITVKDEEDSISLPDLELIDVYRDIKMNADDTFIPIGGVVEAHTNLNTVAIKTEDIHDKISDVTKYDEVYSADVSLDAISVSSNDCIDSEEFEEPVGFFIGGDFDHTDENSNANTCLSQYQRNEVPSSSDEEEQVGPSGTGSCEDTNNIQMADEPVDSTTRFENVEKAYKESTFNETSTVDNPKDSSSSSSSAQHNDNLSINYSSNCNVTSTKKEPKKKRTSVEPKRALALTCKANLKCLFCSQSCSTFQLLQEHFKQLHPKEECYIECCQRKLKDALAIEEHMRFHNGPKSKRRRSKELDDIIAQWRPSLECGECSASCSSFTLLQDHYRQQHSDRRCYVKCCNLMLKQRSSVEEHIRYHKDPEMFKCKLCGKWHTSRLQLYSHMVYRHSNSKDASSPDNANVANMKIKRKRQKSQQDSKNCKDEWEAKLECIICHELYSSHRQLQLHFHQNHPKDEHQIIQCRNKLTRRHKIMEPVPLDPPPADTSQNTTSTCRKSCQELDEFIAHYEPKLKCVDCSESCTSFTRLKCHFREKHPNRNCHILCCQRKLTLRSAVAEHISLHIDPNIFKCKVCGRCHVNKNQLLAHMKLQHTKSLEDVQKNATCENEAVVRITHKELDEFIAQHRPHLVCALCDVRRENFLQLKRHFAQKHSHEECHILCCELKLKNRYQLEEHLRYHINTNAFRCEVCSETFRDGVSLYRHKLTQHPLTAEDGVIASVKRSVGTNQQKEKLMRKDRLLKKRYDNLIAQWKPILECAVCKEMCSTFTLLENHFCRQHPTEQFYVLCCQHKWEQQFRMVEHIRRQHGIGLPKIKAGKSH